MKKLTAMACAAVMTAGLAMSAAAAVSIGQLIPEQPTLVEGEIPDGAEVVVEDVITENYANQTVADVVTAFNDEDTTMTVEETLEALDVDLTEEIVTTSDTVIDPTEYEALMPFVEVALKEGDLISYEIDGEVTVKMTVEVVKGLKAEDLIIMQVDPDTAEVYFIEIDPEKFDSETGEMTVTFPCLGPFTILEKSAAAE